MAASKSGTIALPMSVDLDAVDEVRQTLMTAFEDGPVTVSGAEVERVATNALLLLVSAAETARRNGFAFAVADASAPMLAAIDRLGLSDQFAGMMKG